MADDNPEPKGKLAKMKMILLIAGAALLLVLVSVGLTWWLVYTPAPPPEPAAMDLQNQTQVQALGPARYHQIQPPFVVNFPVGNRVRFLQVELSVLAREQEALDVVIAHMPLIRNNLLIILQRQNVQELLTDAGKESLQQQLTTGIQEVVNQQLGRPGIENVLFVSFVVQ